MAFVRAAESAGGVLTLTMTHAAKRNALSSAMMAALSSALHARAPAARAVVLRAEGSCFSAGHDLAELSRCSDLPAAEAEAALQGVFAACGDLMRAIREAPVPVIACVEGHAHAAGCELAATCDLLVADERATFATPGVRIGLFCHTPAVAVVRALGGGAAGARRAAKMLYTGEPVSASEAAAMGLVHELTPPGGAPAAAYALADKIAGASGDALRGGKATLRASSAAPDVESAYAMARSAMVRGAVHADAREGVGAFLEKRAPEWTT